MVVGRSRRYSHSMPCYVIDSFEHRVVPRFGNLCSNRFCLFTQKPYYVYQESHLYRTKVYLVGVSSTISPNLKSSLDLSGDATMNSSSTESSADPLPCDCDREY